MLHMLTFVTAKDDIIEFGNEYIVRSFSVKDNRFKPRCIKNERTDGETLLTLRDGSEEFIVSIKGAFKNKLIKASSLIFKGMKKNETDDGLVITFYFEPYKFGNSELNFTLSYSLEATEYLMKKTVSISSPDDKKIKIDYIDSDSLVLGDDVISKWSRPDMKKAFLSPFHSALGQPVYINGLYFGSEFPMNDNNIVDGTAHLRYYSGKTIEQLRGDAPCYTTWNSVCGAARSLDFDVIRADFLEYIKSISRPVYLRTQYNSWYDFMMDISAENIEHSFFEIEKGLTQYGVKPLASYVVDDGWNDYNKNFWCFNSKFPNELYDSSDLAHRFSSEFGLWLGPRGGYNYNNKFGRQMQRAHTGGHNRQSHDICIADFNYIKNVSDLFVDYMDRFDIGYWKLDGFLLKSCKSKKHGHMTGGYENMYCLTECWENWIKVFTKMYEFRKSQHKNLWINLTCYAVPSPWLLQWVNSVWMQNSNDNGFIDKTTDGKQLKGCDADKMLTYRDTKYYDFHKVRAYQFPNSNMYNHEPIYGNSAKIHMENEEYRKYMYMLATRGTAFWELYYSYNLFNHDMWKINADVLSFIEDNFSVLQNSKMIGGSPETGAVYGYSAWADGKGIISLRNPCAAEQKFSVNLDRLIGVNDNSKNMTATTIIPYSTTQGEITYSYGDTFEAVLAPHCVMVISFAEDNRHEFDLTRAKFIDNNTLEVCFNNHIVIDNNSFTINGVTVNAELQADYSSVIIKTDTFTDKSKVVLGYNITDIFGKELVGDKEITYHKDLIICRSADAPCEITEDFTLSCVVSGTPRDTMLFMQGNEMALSLVNGNVHFDCIGVKAKGKADITSLENVKINAVREKNGMVKVYVNGELDCSGYDKTIVNPCISAADIKLGTSIKEFTVINKALAFDEV